MSEFRVEVVKIESIEKHPNADLLSVATVKGNYPVIVKNGEYKVGDEVVYVPIDSIVPLDDSRFSFLSSNRIKAKKLRGIFSMGLIVKKHESWKLGQNVQQELKILKWEPKLSNNLVCNTENEEDPGYFPVYTSIEGFRANSDLFNDGEEVVITEKIHGSNARYLFRDNRLWVGSHHRVKKLDERNAWWKVAITENFENRFKDHAPNIVVYGEIFGDVQDLKYGCKQGQVLFRAFDCLNTDTMKYLDYDEFEKTCALLSLPIAPVLYRGPWKKELLSLAEGQTTIADHVREGIIIRPVTERWDRRVGRVILKYIGEGYYLRKNA